MNETIDTRSARWDLYRDAAGLAAESGQLERAVRLYTAALKEAEQFGEMDTRLPATIENLLDLYEHMIKVAHNPTYEALANRLLHLQEGVFGTESMQLESTLDRLARAYYANGKLADAEAVYRRLIKLEESHLGSDDSAVADTLQDLALALRDSDSYAEQEEVWKRAIAIIEHAEGPQTLKLAGLLENLAEVYVAAKKYSDAVATLEHAVRVLDQPNEYGFTPIRVLQRLAELQETQGAFANAEPLYRRALALQEQLESQMRVELASSTVGAFARTMGLRDIDEEASALLHHYAAVLRALGREKESTTMETRASARQAEAEARSELLADVERIAQGSVNA